jgi:hypothetical protein
MKKFVGFYYRCGFNVCLLAFLPLICLMVLSSAIFAQQSGYITYTESGGIITITGYTGCPDAATVVIPGAIDGKPVLYIGDSAFNGCHGLTSVTIPDSVTSIGNLAFQNCSSLTSVTIPASVTSIGTAAFVDCSSLTSIVVDASNTVYSSQAGVLYDKAMTELIQYSCGKSGGFTIPDSVTSIGVYAFFGCTGLTSVTIPASVASIGDSAFNKCHGLTSVTIPNSVTSIGNWAFNECNGLTSVTIPNSVTSIGNGAFHYCTGLTSIVVDASNIVYSSQDDVLYDKAMTELIQYSCGKSGGFTIPDGVTSIGEVAFWGCTGLTSVTIPDSVTSIEYEAFAGCSVLTRVTIPASVTSIGTAAFVDCSSLAIAFFYGNAPSMGQSVFGGCSSNFTVCYTAGSTGFTTPWYGYPAAVCSEATSSTTSVPSTNTTTTPSITTTIPNGSSTTTISENCPSDYPVDCVNQGYSGKCCTGDHPVCCGNGCCPQAYPYCGRLNQHCYNEPPGLCALNYLLTDDSWILNKLREVRDNILSKTEKGREYVVIFYASSPELISVMKADDAIRVQAMNLLYNIIPDVLASSDSNRVVSDKATAIEIENICNMIGRKASPKLKKVIEKLKRDIREGKIFEQLDINSNVRTN